MQAVNVPRTWIASPRHAYRYRQTAQSQVTVLQYAVQPKIAVVRDILAAVKSWTLIAAQKQKYADLPRPVPRALLTERRCVVETWYAAKYNTAVPVQGVLASVRVQDLVMRHATAVLTVYRRWARAALSA